MRDTEQSRLIFLIKSVDPKKFGIHPSTKIEQIDNTQFVIRIEKKAALS